MKRFNLFSALLSVVLIISLCILPTASLIVQASSAAEYYYGDINYDGTIDKFDYIIVKRYCMNTITLEGEQLLRGDVNQSGAIDKFDYILIKRHCMNTYSIPPVTVECDHDYLSIVTPPTETDRGYTTHTCKICGDSYVDSFVDPITPSEPCLDYVVNEDGKTCTITGIGTITSSELVIPSEIDGYTVTVIGNEAFADNRTITSVTIPDSVKSIGDYAFRWCENLNEVIIGNNVEYIGVYAFRNCYALTSITITDRVKSIGTGAFWYCTNLYNVFIGYNVEIIDSSAFWGCSSLTSITIPDNVKGIGDYVFYYCDNLQTVNLGKGIKTIGNNAFGNCSYITDVYYTGTEDDWANIEFGTYNDHLLNATIHYLGEPEIPEEKLEYSVNKDEKTCTITGIGTVTSSELVIPSEIDGYKVTSIADGAFEGCLIIFIVVIPDTVITISSNAFSGCANLEEITIPSSVTTMENAAFIECENLKSVYYLGDINDWLGIDIYLGNGNPCCYGANLYFNGELVTELVIPEGVTEIGGNAFFGCHSITKVTIPDSVTVIGNGAFTSCSYIVIIILGKNVTEIRTNAFYGCESLEQINIPASVTTIGNGAFISCRKLKTVDFEGDISDWLGISFGTGESNPCRYGANLYFGGKLVTEVNVPEGVTEIKQHAFYGCSSITSINIPASVTVIGNNAFRDCIVIIIVILGDNLVSIGDYAFYGCTSITNITIPNNVTSIGSHAFMRCTNLATIVIGKSVATVGDKAFNNCASVIEIFYCGSASDWEIIDFGANNSIITNSNVSFDYSPECNHTYGDWHMNSESHWKQCECGNIESYESHTITSTVTPPTETDRGYTTHLCSVCGYTYTDSYVDPVTPPASEGLAYSVNSDGTTCTITGIGTCTDTELVIPETIDGYTVTAIGEQAFLYNSSLTSIIIPNSVTEIHSSAFYYCTAVTSIILPDNLKSIGDYAFYYCKSLQYTEYDNALYIGSASNPYMVLIKAANKNITSCIINTNTEFIYDDAFRQCYDLTEIRISDSVHSIGHYAFAECGISGIEIPDGVTQIAEYTFDGCYNLVNIKLPDSITVIGQYAFRNCDSLVDVTIPKNATVIGRGAFNSCSNLANVTFEGQVDQIVSYAFRYCYGLKKITIRSFRIGEYAFAGCSNLTEVIIENGTNCIEKSAFSECTALQSITIPESCTYIYEYAFYNCAALKDVYYTGTYEKWCQMTIKANNEYLTIANNYYNGKLEAPSYSINNDGVSCTITGIGSFRGTDLVIPSEIDGYKVTAIGNDAFKKQNTLASVTIPDSVISIGDYAFFDCSKLTLVNIGSNVINIGNYSFASCDVLTSIILPEPVISIGDYAFYYCEKLQTVNLGNGIETIGAYAFYDCTALTSITIPDSVTSIGNEAFYECINLQTVALGNGIETIGADAFQYCYALTSVTIPNSVTSIGDSAFCYCENLQNVNLGNGIKTIGRSAFYYCTALISITIPDSVTSIGGRAFYGCTNLQTVNLGNGIETIGEGAFIFCTSLTSITIPDSVTSIGTNAFDGCINLQNVNLGNGIETIGAYAFYDCPNLTDVYYAGSAEDWAKISIGTYGNSYLTNATIHYLGEPEAPAEKFAYTVNEDGTTCTITGIGTITATDLVIPSEIDGYTVTEIGDMAFSNCRNLTSIAIGEGVTSIGEKAFYYCINLTSITLPDSVTEISNHTFCGCYDLTSIIIPDSITSIGSSAFHGCTSLTSIIIPNSVTSIGNSAFGDCSSLTSVTIGDGVTEIGEEAFAGCESLASVTFGNSIITIDKQAFWYCSKLTNVTIPNSVTTIGQQAFDNCGLTSVTIGNGVTTFGAYAFGDCTELKSVTILDGATSIGATSFSGCSNLTSIIIPDSVTSIGSSAFGYCSKLTDVYYAGSAEDWSKIAIDTTGNSYLLNATIHYLGEPVVPAEQFEYEVNSDGTTCTITGIGNVTATDLVIPSEIDGYKVTAIGYAAFERNSSITSIIIPDSVTSIGSYAFNYCINLQNVNLGNGIETIGAYAFQRCYALTSITIPDSVTSIDTSAFYSCSNLTEVYYEGSKSDWANIEFGTNNDYLLNATIHYLGEPEAPAEQFEYEVNSDGTTCTIRGIGTITATELVIPSEIDGYTVTAIGKAAFKDNTAITSVTILNEITYIGELAFQYCESLQTVTLGSCVQEIDSDAFAHCYALKSIVIPNSVTKLGTAVFQYCQNLESVVIGKGLTQINHAVFQFCYNLNKVTLPSSITYIGVYAFDDCPYLSNIYYGGTEKEWQTVVIDEENSPLTNATIHFNEAQGVMSYEEFLAAEIGATVTVETYVQGNQSWWDNSIILYCQSPDGGYLLYEVACSEKDAAKLVKGTKIRVTGSKAVYAGEVEIMDGTFEFVNDGDTYIAEPKDITDKLGKDDLIDYMNQLVTFKGLTVKSIDYKNGAPGNDIYVTFTKDGKDYDFMVEVYLTGTESDVYKTVGTLQEGDIVDVTGFLYWYNGADTHITEITVVESN